MKKTVILLLLGLSSFMKGQNCENDFFSHYSFEEIKSILDKNECSSCHYSQNQSIWQYENYNSFLYSSYCVENIVKHGDAGNSTIIKVLQGEFDCMSIQENVHSISVQDKRAIETWINTGAPENCVPLFNEISAILDKNNCNSCHNPESTIWKYSPSINLDIKAKTYCVGDKVVRLYDANASALYKIISNDECSQGHVNSPMTQEEISKIGDWINSGAPYNAATLPLQLISFNTYLKSNIPNLIWTTANEVGVKNFEIQRSPSDKIDFVTIGMLNANGGDLQNYRFEDIDILSGDYYYRVKIVDFDGRHEYSPLEFVRLTSREFVFNMYPNPSRNGQYLLFKWYSKGNIQSSAHLELLDESGRFIQSFDIKNGTNKLDMPALPNGLYYFRLLDFYGGSHYERLVIAQ